MTLSHETSKTLNVDRARIQYIILQGSLHRPCLYQMNVTTTDKSPLDPSVCLACLCQTSLLSLYHTRIANEDAVCRERRDCQLCILDALLAHLLTLCQNISHHFGICPLDRSIWFIAGFCFLCLVIIICDQSSSDTMR